MNYEPLDEANKPWRLNFMLTQDKGDFYKFFHNRSGPYHSIIIEDFFNGSLRHYKELIHIFAHHLFPYKYCKPVCYALPEVAFIDTTLMNAPKQVATLF